MEHFLYHITSWGFVKQSFDALADGIMEVSRPTGVECGALAFAYVLTDMAWVPSHVPQKDFAS